MIPYLVSSTLIIKINYVVKELPFLIRNNIDVVGISSHSEDDEDEYSAPLMILEYMPYGDLQGFLESHKYLQICLLSIHTILLNYCRPHENGQTAIREKQFHTFACDVRM